MSSGYGGQLVTCPASFIATAEPFVPLASVSRSFLFEHVNHGPCLIFPRNLFDA